MSDHDHAIRCKVARLVLKFWQTSEAEGAILAFPKECVD